MPITSVYRVGYSKREMPAFPFSTVVHNSKIMHENNILSPLPQLHAMLEGTKGTVQNQWTYHADRVLRTKMQESGALNQAGVETPFAGELATMEALTAGLLSLPTLLLLFSLL